MEQLAERILLKQLNPTEQIEIAQIRSNPVIEDSDNETIIDELSTSYSDQNDHRIQVDNSSDKTNYNATLRCSFAECSDLRFNHQPSLFRHTRFKHYEYLHQYFIHLRPFRTIRYPQISNHVLKIQETSRQFKCDQCDKSFKKKGRLNFHVEQAHAVKKVFNCQFKDCTRTFESESELERHRGVHYRGERSSRRSMQQVKLQEHLVTRRNKSSNRDEQAWIVADDYDSDEESIVSTESDEDSTDETIDSESLDEFDLDEEVSSEDSTSETNNSDEESLKEMVLDDPDETDLDEEDLDQPEHQPLETLELQQPPPELNKPANESNSVSLDETDSMVSASPKTSVKSQLNQSPANCPKCRKSFKSKISVYRHLRKVHSKKLFTCEVSGCNSEFQGNNQLCHHYSTMHKGIDFPCDQIKVLNNRKDLLVDHFQRYRKINIDPPKTNLVKPNSSFIQSTSKQPEQQKSYPLLSNLLDEPPNEISFRVLSDNSNSSLINSNQLQSIPLPSQPVPSRLDDFYANLHQSSLDSIQPNLEHPNLTLNPPTLFSDQSTLSHLVQHDNSQQEHFISDFHKSMIPYEQSTLDELSWHLNDDTVQSSLEQSLENLFQPNTNLDEFNTNPSKLTLNPPFSPLIQLNPFPSPPATPINVPPNNLDWSNSQLVQSNSNSNISNPNIIQSNLNLFQSNSISDQSNSLDLLIPNLSYLNNLPNENLNYCFDPSEDSPFRQQLANQSIAHESYQLLNIDSNQQDQNLTLFQNELEMDKIEDQLHLFQESPSFLPYQFCPNQTSPLNLFESNLSPTQSDQSNSETFLDLDSVQYPQNLALLQNKLEVDLIQNHSTFTYHESNSAENQSNLFLDTPDFRPYHSSPNSTCQPFTFQSSPIQNQSYSSSIQDDQTSTIMNSPRHSFSNGFVNDRLSPSLSDIETELNSLMDYSLASTPQTSQISSSFDDLMNHVQSPSSSSSMSLSSTLSSPSYSTSSSSSVTYQKSVNHHQMLRSIPVREFVCTKDNCRKTFIKLETLKAHQKIVHQGKSRTFRCTWTGCGLQFDRAYLLQKHREQVHTGVRVYKCDYPGCNKTTINNGNMHKHRMFVHEKVKVMCKYANCGQMFSNYFKLARHRRSMHTEGAKTFCGKVQM